MKDKTQSQARSVTDPEPTRLISEKSEYEQQAALCHNVGVYAFVFLLAVVVARDISLAPNWPTDYSQTDHYHCDMI